MNAINAFIFVTLGSVMGVLPLLFPSWFPPSGADASSTRALWLDVMAITQIGLGLGYIAQAHLYPFASRILSAIPASDTGTLALPNPRSVSER